MGYAPSFLLGPSDPFSFLMKDFLKHKFSRKLFNLLRFKRHCRLRSSISFTKKKMAIGPVIVYKQHSRLFFLKHLDFSSFFFEPFLSSSLTLSSSWPEGFVLFLSESLPKKRLFLAVLGRLVSSALLFTASLFLAGLCYHALTHYVSSPEGLVFFFTASLFPGTVYALQF